VLAALRYGGPRRIGDLARHEGLSQPTVTQTVTALEDAGLVRRRADPVDGRGRVVELTAEGRALVRRARARKIAWVRASVAPRPATEQDIVAAVAAELDRRAH
jgi:DNA-binding MarR family transcriptional regulator